MDEASIFHLLHSIAVDISRHTYTGGGDNTKWLNIKCPLAPWLHASGTDNTPSFGITVNEEGRSYYKCFACSSKGSLARLPSLLGSYRHIDYSAMRQWAEIEEVSSVSNRPLPEWDDDATTSPRKKTNHIPESSLLHDYPLAFGLPYLRQRGLTWNNVLALGLLYDRGQQRVLFPIFDDTERFRGFTGRSVMAEHRLSKYNPKVRDYFGLDKRRLFLGPRRALDGEQIIVEGLFDYAKVRASGYQNTFAALGTSLTDEKIEVLLQRGKPVYLFFDNDLAGWLALFGKENPETEEWETKNAWAFRLYNELPVWIVPYAGVIDDGGDPGSMSCEGIRRSIDKAWLFTGKPPRDELGEPTFKVKSR